MKNQKIKIRIVDKKKLTKKHHNYIIKPMFKLSKITKYIIIGLAIGIILSVGYYFFDYQNKPKEEAPIGVSKEKVLLADQAQYDLDIVLNSIISNQIVLQNSIRLLDEKISSLEDKIKSMEEQNNETDNNIQ